MPSLPWFKFFIGDWLKDSSLSLCKPATRGIWIDLICRMEETGKGTFGAPLDDLCRIARCTGEEMRSAISDLKMRGAAQISEENGFIYITCKRIERDLAKKAKCSEAGRRGGGNPNLCKKDKGQPKGGPKGPSDICLLTSNSVSDSSEGMQGEEPEPKVDWEDIPVGLHTERFRTTWEEWKTHRRELGHTLKETTRTKQLRKLAEMGEARAIAALQHSMTNGWQGIFEPTGNGQHSTAPKPPPTREEIAKRLGLKLGGTA